MFRVRYANEEAERGWLELHHSTPEAWALAAEVLSRRPTTPTVRCFALPTARLRMKGFKRSRYPQWAYLVSNELQIHYLVDAENRIVWVVRLARHRIRGLDV